MHTSSTSEFFRVLYPGAVVAVLAFVVSTTVGALPLEVSGAWQELIRGSAGLADWIQDPFRAIVFASSIGLVLYYVDPAYAAPEYNRNLPSSHLKQRLTESGYPAHESTGLYLLALNDLVSPALRDRILVSGAMYRIGFTAVFFTYVFGSAACLLIILALGPGEFVLRLPERYATWLALMGIIGLIALFLWRSWSKSPEGKDDASSNGVPESNLPVQGVLLMAGLTVAGLALFSFISHHGLARLLLMIGWLFALGVWSVLRLRGPRWREWTRSVAKRGSKPFRPSEPWQLRDSIVLDGGLVVAAYVPIALVEDHLSTVQLFSPAILLGTAMVLAYLRKYERQLHGVYRNQNVWIDLHIDTLAEWAQRLEDEPRRGGPAN